MLNKILPILCIALTLCQSVRANDLHLRLPDEAQAVLQTKPNALTLEDIQKRVVSDNIDIQLSFEKLFQAQKRIGVARAQFFPYGAGTVAAMYLLNIWNPLLLVELATSIPSKVYTVQVEKNLKKAQKYSNKALKENIKNQVAQLYFNILKEEATLKLTRLEIDLLEKLMRAHEDRIALGLGSENDLVDVELRLLDTKEAYLKFSSYLVAEKLAFNMMLAETPEAARQIELQTVPGLLNENDYQLSVDALVDMAVENSPEIASSRYMVTAAAKNKKSAKWSILSFGGIGFGYWAKVQVAGSKVKEAQMHKRAVQQKIMSQVHVAEKSFKRSLNHLANDVSVFQDTEAFTVSDIEQFRKGYTSLDSLIETELIYLKDFKNLVLSHYDAHIKLDDLERTTLTEVRTIENNGVFKVNMSLRSNNRYILSLSSESLALVDKVEYRFESVSGLEPLSSRSPVTGFAVLLKKIPMNGLAGYALITLSNGQIIKQPFSF